jgi:hypothetical protein
MSEVASGPSPETSPSRLPPQRTVPRPGPDGYTLHLRGHVSRLEEANVEPSGRFLGEQNGNSAAFCVEMMMENFASPRQSVPNDLQSGC